MLGDLPRAGPAAQQENTQHLEGSRLQLATARGGKDAVKDSEEHRAALDMLNRDIRGFASRLLVPGLPPARSDLVASLIEEADFAASLGETLHQIARRVKRE